MNLNGRQLIDKIVDILKEKNKSAHDYQILNELKKLDEKELNYLITFGEIPKFESKQ